MSNQEGRQEMAEEHEFIKRHGKTITGQLNISYSIEQTVGQFLEIREQGGDDEITTLFDEELFLEYVMSNVVEQIENEVRYNGRKSLEREIVLLNDEGEVLN